MNKNYYYLTRHNQNDRVVVELTDDEAKFWQNSGRILEPVFRYGEFNGEEAKRRYYSATPPSLYWSKWDAFAEFIVTNIEKIDALIRNTIIWLGRRL